MDLDDGGIPFIVPLFWWSIGVAIGLVAVLVSETYHLSVHLESPMVVSDSSRVRFSCLYPPRHRIDESSHMKTRRDHEDVRLKNDGGRSYLFPHPVPHDTLVLIMTLHLIAIQHG